MISLEILRSEMEKQLENDQNIKYVEVSADTLEEALADAAVQLGASTSTLEYELLEQGFKGFATLLKKPWIIRAYVNQQFLQKTEKILKKSNLVVDSIENDALPKDIDGIFYVHYFDSAINLKVVHPVGRGIPVSFQSVMLTLQRPDITSLDQEAIKHFVVKGTKSVYQQIGAYKQDDTEDATISIDISNDEMTASIIATASGLGGSDISAKRIERLLENEGIIAGIDRKKIDDFIDSPVYGLPYVVANAPAPVDGRDAYIIYHFETDNTKFHMNESKTGQVDFKELNRIQNVVEGQPLAEKIPLERAKDGKTLSGRYLEAKNGKDITLPLGKNVEVAKDGKTIVSMINGQVLLLGDKITVESVMELDSVNIKTGNITFLGTVLIKGNVEEGFHVKASGNIEIHGTVGNSVLEADGDIVVTLGIMGKDEGYVRAGKSLWAKFIQNCTVEVENFVIVQDGIINSNVTSNKKILVQGKRAAIIGGHLFATEEIYAKNIGSSAGGSETILEVGYDPKAKKQLDELSEKQAILVRELDEVDLNLQTLENQKKLRKILPPDKETSLATLTARKFEIHTETDILSKDIQILQDRLRELKVVGKVSASGAVYAGVKVYIRDAKEEVRNEIKAVTFFYDDGFVRHDKYEPPSGEDTKRVPDGYSAN